MQCMYKFFFPDCIFIENMPLMSHYLKTFFILKIITVFGGVLALRAKNVFQTQCSPLEPLQELTTRVQTISKTTCMTIFKGQYNNKIMS